MNSNRARRPGGESGFSYIEVLVATLLIAVALVPMMDSLGPGVQGARIHRDQAQVQYLLAGKLEEVLAQTFDELDAAATTAGDYKIPTSYSDLSAPVPHEVFIWRWDVDNADNDDDEFTGGEDDILWIRVATVGSSTELQTLLSKY